MLSILYLSLKSKEKEHFRKLKTELKNIEQNNPKQFWSIIKSIQIDDNVVYKKPINNQTWEEYLNKLDQNSSQDNGLLNNPSASFNHEEVGTDVIINRKITRSEVRKAIKRLKNGKSAGEDNIINEVLKTGEFCLVEPIVKLMNLILESEKYPLTWTEEIYSLHCIKVASQINLIIVEVYQSVHVYPNYLVLSIY